MSSRLSQEILRCWETATQGTQKINCSGLTPSARAYTLAQILTQSPTQSRFLVICSHSDQAIGFHQDLKTFFHFFNRADLFPKTDYFPGWELSPYRAYQPSVRNRVKRLRTLYRLLDNQTQVIITDVSAFAQRVPNPELIFDRSLSIKVGDFLNREELSFKLRTAGYLENDPVEDPGQFAFRGNIFDVFSPGGNSLLGKAHPFRIEFFGDEVESIRTYDSLNQRSHSQTLERADIIPVTEWILNEETISIAKTKVKEFCDEKGISKSVRDEFYEHLDDKIYDPSWEYLTPFFTNQPRSSLLDYLTEQWSVVIDDRLAIDAQYDKLLESLKKDYERALEEQKIVAPWLQLYLAPEELKQIESKTSLQFDAVALGVPQDVHKEETRPLNQERIEVQTTENTDFVFQANQKPALNLLEEKATQWREQEFTSVVCASTPSQAERLSYLLSQKEVPVRIVSAPNWEDHAIIQIVEGSLTAGFRLPYDKVAIVTDAEIFGPKKGSRQRKVESKSKKTAQSKESSEESLSADFASFVSSLDDLNSGELIVHKKHGIGRYNGLVKLEIDKIPQDFLLLEYAGGDKLYLPVYRLDQVQKYLGDQALPTLDKLGSNQFEKTKQKVKAELQDLAFQLLQLYAKRSSREGFRFSPPGEAYREFEGRFPYVETPDQQKAIEDVLEDLASNRIMDRLVCGDVGYGKTEVAMRAAFLVGMEGKQVGVLVPTTVLALQHERSFRERFKDTPLRIAGLSRFKTKEEINRTLFEIKEGKIDIVIGTHRLLSKDVHFKDLGLIIVDEEQRFGVEHKEKLKSLKVNTDVLTLTATPIPRTLHLSLMGLRDISVINTPPVDRLSIRTYVAKFEEDVIRKAIEFEIARGGQVFFIHNRVQSIHAMADRLQAIVPDAKIIVAHGQLGERDLEQRMLDFYNKKAHILLCSTIIESGLDIPSANTMIINRADMFGLAQLYQLRGRVGRSQMRAYCYLLLPETGSITDESRKRLEVIQRFADLGSGFKVASHDLELRGGGDILGKAQSGQIAAVGYELYTELLDETIREMKGQEVEDKFDPEIKVPVAARIPEDYVPDIHQRLGWYKRLSEAHSSERLQDLEQELQDRYGKLPTEVFNLVWLIRIKQVLARYHIKTLTVGNEKAVFDASEATNLSPRKMIELIQKNSKKIGATQDSKIVLRHEFKSIQALHHEVHSLLSQVAQQ